MQLIDCLRLLVKYVEPFKEIQPVLIKKDGSGIGTMRYETPNFMIIVTHSCFLEKVEGLDDDFGVEDLGLLKAILAHPHYQDCTASIIRTRTGEYAALLKGSNNSSHTVFLRSRAQMSEYKQRTLPRYTRYVSFEATVVGTALLEDWHRKAIEFCYDKFVIYTDSRMRVRAAFGLFEAQLCRFTLAQQSSGVIHPHYSYDTPRLLQLMKYCKTGATVKISVAAVEGKVGFLIVEVTAPQIKLTALVMGEPVGSMIEYHEAVAKNDAELMPYLMTGEEK